MAMGVAFFSLMFDALEKGYFLDTTDLHLNRSHCTSSNRVQHLPGSCIHPTF